MDKPKSLRRRLYLAVNNAILSMLPSDGVGPFWGRFFKLPVYQYRLGLGFLIEKKILILTTTGRVSGLPRQTALEYEYDPERHVFRLTAGWKGKSDWLKNLKADPNVDIQVGRRGYTCRAEMVPKQTVKEELAQYVEINPQAKSQFSRWIGQPFNGSDEALEMIADFMPMVDLHVVDEG